MPETCIPADPDEARYQRLVEIMPRDVDEAHAVITHILARFPAIRDDLAEMSLSMRTMAETAAGVMRFLADLDRCVHGRHRIDTCFACPAGHSTGNLSLKPGQVVGHTVHGRPLVVPPEGAYLLQRESWLGEWPA